jgi:hypothetical protein
MSRSICLSGVAAVALASGAHAALTMTSSQAAYTYLVNAATMQSSSFSFPGSSGFVPVYSAGSGDDAFVASAQGGLWSTSNFLATNNAEQGLTITFASNRVFGVSGTMFDTDNSFNILNNSLIQVTLANGQSYVGASSSTNFVGFVSTDQAIASVTIKPLLPDGTQHAALSSLTVSTIPVPAPGALALLAVAGAAATRRRR